MDLKDHRVRLGSETYFEYKTLRDHLLRCGGGGGGCASTPAVRSLILVRGRDRRVVLPPPRIDTNGGGGGHAQHNTACAKCMAHASQPSEPTLNAAGGGGSTAREDDKGQPLDIRIRQLMGSQLRGAGGL